MASTGGAASTRGGEASGRGREVRHWVEVVIRPRPDGDFEAEDASATPSLLANGRPVRSVRLGARGNDVVLLLGPVEAVHAEPCGGTSLAHGERDALDLRPRRRGGRGAPAATAPARRR